MKDLFVPYEQSLQLKELGFNERCFGFYELEKLVISTWRMNANSYLEIDFEEGKPRITAPIFAQAFEFFREKYNLYTNIDYDWNDNVFRVKIMKQNEDKSCNIIFLKEGEYIKDYSSFKEAELACIEKLIQIIKTK